MIGAHRHSTEARFRRGVQQHRVLAALGAHAAPIDALEYHRAMWRVRYATDSPQLESLATLAQIREIRSRYTR